MIKFIPKSQEVRRLFSAVLLFVLCAAGLKAQNNPNRLVRNSKQQWIQYYTTTSLSDNWRLLIDAGFRWNNNFQSPSQYIIRGAVGYEFESGLRLAVGYAGLGYYNGSNVNVNESRPYQELQYPHNLGTIGLKHRLRVEERFFRSNFERQSSVRFRYSFMVQLFDFNIMPSHPDFKLIFNLGNEIFLSAGNDDLPTAFNQNRLIISPTLAFSKNFEVGITWNSQYAATDESDVFDKTEVIWIQVKHTF